MTCISEKLTPELWNKVLEKLEDPLDRLNALEVLNLTELNEKKAGWLFAVTLPVVLKQLDYPVNYYNMASKNTRLLRKAFFSCRLVSRDCFNAVGKFVDGHWEDCDYNYSPHLRIHTVFMPSLTRGSIMQSRSRVCGCFDKIKHHSLQTCPILTKHLTFCFFGPIQLFRINQTYANANTQSILELLERIGHFLRSVTFHIILSNREDTRAFVTRALPLLPNVRNITFQFCSTFLAEVEENWELDSNQSTILPNLPSLKTLSINPMMGISFRVPISIPFQFYFTQITILQLDVMFWTAEFNQPDLFPNLERVFLEHVLMHHETAVNNVIEILRNVDAPQLKYFQINSKILFKELFKIAEANMGIVEEKGLSVLSEKHAKKEWKSTSGVWENKYFSTMCLKIYDSGAINVPPLKSQRRGLVQRIVNFLLS